MSDAHGPFVLELTRSLDSEWNLASPKSYRFYNRTFYASAVENVTDEVSNPFGMRPPCPHRCTAGSDRTAVFGYGDANADFHVIGDHAGIHGGTKTGVPFTGTLAGDRILDVLAETGFLTERDDGRLPLSNCFLSYLYLCCVPEGTAPTPEDYATFERFFDAEFRAINPHVVLPVGERPTTHVLEEYTARAHRIELDMASLHATEIRGRGVLVVPIREPTDWDADDADRIVATITDILASDYQQLSDLGRFGATGDPYFVH